MASGTDRVLKIPVSKNVSQQSASQSHNFVVKIIISEKRPFLKRVQSTQIKLGPNLYCLLIHALLDQFHPIEFDDDDDLKKL